MWIGPGRKTLENVGRAFVNVWAAECFRSTVGVLNSLETNKQAPHVHLTAAPQALDNTEAFQKSELHPRPITAQRASASEG